MVARSSARETIGRVAAGAIACSIYNDSLFRVMHGRGIMEVNRSQGLETREGISMTTHVPFDREKERARSRFLEQFAETHREEIDAVTRMLAKITSLSLEQITPHVHTMLSLLVLPQERPFYETATPEEWVDALREWSESHRGMNLPSLSDYAVSRESMYDDERL
ncbi:MAG: chorismate synthase [Stigonema ocellatum SAG 48.90 = DSM 106950]|nr:chorismate synthase [Stigonema ocellatum SAG 48.90 = DSM 106950]